MFEQTSCSDEIVTHCVDNSSEEFRKTKVGKDSITFADATTLQAAEENAILRAKLDSANRRIKELRDTMTLLEASLSMMKSQAHENCVADSIGHNGAGVNHGINSSTIAPDGARPTRKSRKANKGSLDDDTYGNETGVANGHFTKRARTDGGEPTRVDFLPHTTAALSVSPLPQYIMPHVASVYPQPMRPDFQTYPCVFDSGVYNMPGKQHLAAQPAKSAAVKTDDEDEMHLESDATGSHVMLTRHEEKLKIEEFCTKVESGFIRIHQGDLARVMREFVNPSRSAAYFEKLVSRESLNRRWQYLLLPRRPRRKSNTGRVSPEEADDGMRGGASNGAAAMAVASSMSGPQFLSAFPQAMMRPMLHSDMFPASMPSAMVVNGAAFRVHDAFVSASRVRMDVTHQSHKL